MKKNPKKIVLAKETIRNLSVGEAAGVAGGISTNVCTHTSDFRSCGPVSVSVCPPGTGC
ncbi:MAG TPA: class I lanthipeptide [Thermoanaerobaculia bacterium]|nr:class I lanthipeptide [Thermoanaerobaculia bacterium]